MNIDESAKAIADRLLRGLPAEEVWLFGSQARGDASPDSDLDFLAVVSDSNVPGYQRAQRAHALVQEIRFPKDIVVLTRSEWLRQKDVVNTLPYIAKKEGILFSQC